MKTQEPIIENEMLPFTSEKGVRLSNRHWRVKIFWQNEEGQWEDRGTGQSVIKQKVRFK